MALDGSGDFASIQAALASIPRNNKDRVVVDVRNGLYNEKVRLDQDRVTLHGESREGVRIRYNLPRSEYDKRYDAAGPAVLNVFGDDCIVENLTVENRQKGEGHSFAVYGQPNRFILVNCNVLCAGGDTLSLRNTAHGMYYHRNCIFRGGVDFVCPRGWCFIRDSQFEEVSTSASLWHDGHMDLDMKFVLSNCEFDGAKDFWLGRNHYPSQFYLLGCRFGEGLADKPIGTVANLKNVAAKAPFERKYFYNCHRTGGDFAWFANNLQSAPGSPKPDAITAAWTFGGRWDPESTAPPTVTDVETEGNNVHGYFSEDVAGVEHARVLRADGSAAVYRSGDGTRRLLFQGGDEQSPPRRLDPNGDSIYGTVAALEPRIVDAQDLPHPGPVKRIAILVIGDSTVADYKPAEPRQGWGEALRRFFDDRVTVINAARNGRSSKSFRAEGLWDQARKTKADYVFIQFGHNDNPDKGPDRQTDPGPDGDFRKNLAQYVGDARAMGATPILVSPPTRRVFKDGYIDPAEANVPYAQATLAMAKEQKCASVDLNTLSRDLFDRLGETTSDPLQVEEDRTHFTPAGARQMAALVLADLQKTLPDLKPYIDQNALLRP